MTPVEMQAIDAVLLFTIAICCLIAASEDLKIKPIMRLGVLGVGFCAFSQCLWLLGFWTPSSAGYPWPRLSFDAFLTVTSIARAWALLSEKFHQSFRERRKVADAHSHWHALH